MVGERGQCDIDYTSQAFWQNFNLALTNREVQIMFENMVHDWFSGSDNYNDFIKALLSGDLKAMNSYMNRVAEEMFSSFDSGTKPSEKTYRDGKWVMFEPTNTADFDDYMKLLAIKRRPNYDTFR